MSRLKKQTKFYENTMQKLDLRRSVTSLCIEYRGKIMTLNLKDPMIYFLFFIYLFINSFPNW